MIHLTDRQPTVRPGVLTSIQYSLQRLDFFIPYYIYLGDYIRKHLNIYSHLNYKNHNIDV